MRPRRGLVGSARLRSYAPWWTPCELRWTPWSPVLLAVALPDLLAEALPVAEALTEAVAHPDRAAEALPVAEALLDHLAEALPVCLAEALPEAETLTDHLAEALPGSLAEPLPVGFSLAIGLAIRSRPRSSLSSQQRRRRWRP